MLTLKEKFEHKRVDVLQEKLQHIDKNIISKGITSRLIQEAIDRSQLEKINKVLKMLQALPKGLQELDTTVKAIMSDLNENIGEDHIEYSIAFAMETATIITAGFNNLQLILENNFEKEQFDPETSITKMLAAGGKEANVKRQLVMSFTKEKIKRTFWQKFTRQIVGAATGKGKEGYKAPHYLDPVKLVENIINAPLGLLSKIIKTIEKSTGMDIGNQSLASVSGGSSGGGEPSAAQGKEEKKSGGGEPSAAQGKEEKKLGGGEDKGDSKSKKGGGGGGIKLGDFDDDVLSAARKVKPALRGVIDDKKLAQVMKAAKDLGVLKTGGAEKAATEPKPAATETPAEPAAAAKSPEKAAAAKTKAAAKAPKKAATEPKRAEAEAPAEPAAPAKEEPTKADEDKKKA